MRVLAVCSYPIEAAATRYRLAQFVKPLAEKGIELEISSFLDKTGFDLLYRKSPLQKKVFSLTAPFLQRIAEIAKIRRYDALIVQREALFLGPGFFEWIFQKIGNIPLILDLDDATYIPYTSPTYGKIGSFLKFFGKTDNLIKRSNTVICGNRFIAEYAAKFGVHTEVIPTVVDTAKFAPVEKTNNVPVVGWIGTHSTFPFLESIYPALKKVAAKRQFRLKVVGAGRDELGFNGLETENLVWSLEREINDFQSLDVGLYPMEFGNLPEEWVAGKSGFKAIQYMAVGIPYIVTPIGVCKEIGIEGQTHFTAQNLDEWEKHLSVLLENNTIRQRLGENGRKYALQNFTVELQTDKLAEVLHSVVGEKAQRKK